MARTFPKAKTPDLKDGRSAPWIWGGIIVLAVLAAFGPVVRHEFVAWDDDINVYQNPLLNPATREGVKRVWTAPYLRLYIPLTYTAWAVVARACQRGAAPSAPLPPRPFHAVNLAVHVLAALAAFLLLRRLLYAAGAPERRASGLDAAAAFGAMLFALHPIQTEPVAWVSGLRDLLSGLGALCALAEYTAFAVAQERRRAAVHYALATLALVGAFLCKPSAVVVPLMAALLDHGILRRPLRRTILPLGVWCALALAFAALTQTSQGATHIRALVPLWARPLIAGDSLAFYLWKFAWPFGLSLDYGRPPDLVLMKGWLYYTWTVPAAALLCGWFSGERRIWTVCAGLFVAGVLPVLGFVPFLHQDMSTVADRYLYLSLLGPSLAAAWLLARRADSESYWPWVFAAVVLAGWGVRSRVQAGVWENTGTLFGHAVALNPDNGVTHLNLGNYLSHHGQPEEAKRHYRETLRLRPGDGLALKNMGALLAGEGKLEESADYFTQALVNGNPDIVASAQNALGALHNGLGHAQLRKGNIDGAIAQWSKALAFAPDVVELHHNLGLALLQKGRRQESVKHFQAALKLRPGFEPSRKVLSSLVP